MPILAYDQRQAIKSQLEKGEIPEPVEHFINIYKELREDKSWRGSIMMEALGEYALYCYEQRKSK